VAWSRILDDEEAVCVINAHGVERRGANVLVDAILSGDSLTVLLNTAQTANPVGYSGGHPVGSTLPVRRTTDGIAFVEIRDVDPSEVVVLTNHP
jgi:hypothetical protein